MNHKYKTGDIVAFKNKLIWYNPISILALLIRKVAKINYNHVGIVIEIYGKLFIFEANEHNFIAFPLEERLRQPRVAEYKVFRPYYNFFNAESLRNEALEMLGIIKYDYVGLFNQLILNLFDVWVGRTGDNEHDKMYCYEAVAYLHRKSKLYKKWWSEKPEILFSKRNNEFLEVN